MRRRFAALFIYNALHIFFKEPTAGAGGANVSRRQTVFVQEALRGGHDARLFAISFGDVIGEFLRLRVGSFAGFWVKSPLRRDVFFTLRGLNRSIFFGFWAGVSAASSGSASAASVSLEAASPAPEAASLASPTWAMTSPTVAASPCFLVTPLKVPGNRCRHLERRLVSFNFNQGFVFFNLFPLVFKPRADKKLR